MVRIVIAMVSSGLFGVLVVCWVWWCPCDASGLIVVSSQSSQSSERAHECTRGVRKAGAQRTFWKALPNEDLTGLS